MEIGFDHLVKKNADTADTLALIISTVRADSKSPFVQECSRKLCTGDRYSCIRNVFDYYCRNISYLLDSPGVEKVYTSARTVSEGRGDCKKAATFIGSVLFAAGIDPVFKHVYYHGNDNYTHIYIIIPDPDYTHYITLDPTNDCKYDKEVSHHGATLYFLNGKKMELRQMGKPQYLNGIGWSEEVATGCHSMMGDVEQLSRNVLNADADSFPVQDLRPGAKAVLSQANVTPHAAILIDALAIRPGAASANPMFNKFKTIPFDRQRGAFLALLRKNAFGLATNLVQLWDKSPDKVDQLWKGFGGDVANLKYEILQGAKGKAIHGPQYIGDGDGSSSTWEDIGKYLGMAVPIITAVSNVATIVAPKSGMANNFHQAAIMANTTQNNPISQQIPIDQSGHPVAPGTYPKQGSFFSPIGFVFKTVLMVGIYVPDVAMQGIITGAIVTGTILYCSFKKLMA